MEQVITVALQLSGTNRRAVQESLAELARLVETAGGTVCAEFIQPREHRDPAYLIGQGKVAEISKFLSTNKIQTVVFDENLTPAQQRNLEDALNCKVVDRARLILDIFARRARTREGILQVELAQLDYLLPRLSGKGHLLDSQVGGIGTRRGPGERKLEIDQRRIRERISHLRKSIEKIREHRQRQRQTRQEIPLSTVAIIGYTNVGKSSLLNTLAGKYSVYADDKLFATLDPTTRKILLPSGRTALFTDTVGFIRKLPPTLVAAFRATLEEIILADCWLLLIDLSSTHFREELATVKEILQELTPNQPPIIYAYNKIDLLPETRYKLPVTVPKGLLISVRKGWGLEELLNKIDETFSAGLLEETFCIPYNDGKIVKEIYQKGRIINEEYRPEGIILRLQADAKTLGRIRKYLTQITPSSPVQ